MRVFISIDMPQGVREQIKAIQGKLPDFHGKLTETENLHLTLKFLGEIPESKVEQVKEKLKQIILDEFEIEIDSIGVFSENFIRIIWLHLKNCDELQKKIDEVLRDLFKREDRFMSHLTIARVKSLKDKKTFLNELKKIKIPKIKFPVTCFKLKKSTLTEKGPVYENIEVYNLR